ncbi:MAG TPA: hypothetical protein VF677_08785 [Flavobacterium sp.]
MLIAAGIVSIGKNWDKLRIKDWANRNIGFRQFGDGLKSAGNFITNGMGSIFRGVMNLFKGRRGSEALPLPPTPAISNHQLSGGWQNEGFTSSGTFSGLNQAAHEIQQKQDLMQRLIKVGYSPSKVAVMTDSQVAAFAQKVFPDLYGASGNPTFETVESLGGGVGGRPVKEVSREEGTLKIKFKGVIQLSKISYDSYLSLAATIGHELHHATDYVSGRYQTWANKYGLIGAKALSEISAYNWELSVRSPDYNAEMHNSFILKTQKYGWTH